MKIYRLTAYWYKLSSLLLIGLLLLFSPIINSAEAAKIAGIYSNMEYNEESGDVIGTEIFVLYSVRGYYVLYQSSEGEPSVPQLLPAKVENTVISFTLPLGDPLHGEFKGTITKKELTGHFSNNGEGIKLERKKSYWQ